MIHRNSSEEEKELLKEATVNIVVDADNASTEFPNVGCNYTVLDVIGQGGMGTVYLAKENGSDQQLAIKVIRPELSTDKAALKRFQQESRALAELNHPNIVAVFSDGKTDRGAPYVVMDYIPGQNLAQTIRELGSFDASRALSIILEICDALHYAHTKGVIHRDLKPSNIILMKRNSEPERAKVVDFGIAKVVNKASSETVTGLTQVGDVFGSPIYMSPEQCEGEPLDERSDIYSFGCVMYEMLSGKPPFVEANPFKLMTKHVKEKAPPLVASGVRKELVAVVSKCLEKAPARRYQSANDLMMDLAAVRRGDKPKHASPEIIDSKGISNAAAQGKAEVADFVVSTVRNVKQFETRIRIGLLIAGIVTAAIAVGLLTGRIQSTVSSITTMPDRVAAGSGAFVNIKPHVEKPKVKDPSQNLVSVDLESAKNELPDSEKTKVRELLKESAGNSEALDALTRMGPDIIPTLLDDAASPEGRTNYLAKKAIMAFGPSALPVLVAAFKQENQPAASDLIMRHGYKGFQALKPLYFDEEPKVRVRAIQALYYASEQSLTADVTDTLTWIMLEDLESQVRSEAAAALAKLRATQSRAEALAYSALNDEAFMVRRAAVSSLFRVTEDTRVDPKPALEIGGWLIQHDPNLRMKIQMVPLVITGKIGLQFAPYVKGAYATAPTELKRAILSFCNHKELTDLMFADLLDATTDDDLEFTAMGILGQLGSRSKSALPALEAMKARISRHYSYNKQMQEYRAKQIDAVIKRISEAQY